jgi:hypothetical protein
MCFDSSILLSKQLSLNFGHCLVLVPVFNLTLYHESVWESRTTAVPMHNLGPRMSEVGKFTHIQFTTGKEASETTE